MPGEPLLIDRPLDGVVRLRLNRPERANALDTRLVEDLHDAISDLDARAAVLVSVDSRAFCGGADLDLEDAERMRVSDRLYELYERMSTTAIPLLAAINGPAVGGGAQLAVACDVRVAGPAARLRFVGPGHGLAVGAWALPSLVGRGRAMDLCLSMRWVEAQEALEIGLVDRGPMTPRPRRSPWRGRSPVSIRRRSAGSRQVVATAGGARGGRWRRRPMATVGAWSGSMQKEMT